METTPTRSIPLGDFSSTGSVNAAVAALSAEMGQQNRDAQKKGWTQMLETAVLQKKNDEAQADKIREGAVAGLVGSVVGSGLGVGGSVYQMRGLSKIDTSLPGASQSGSGAQANDKLSQVNQELDRVSSMATKGTASTASNAPAGKDAPHANRTPDQPDPIDWAQIQQNQMVAQMDMQRISAGAQIMSALGQVATQSGKTASGVLDAERKDLEGESKVLSAVLESQRQRADLSGEQVNKLLDVSSNAVSNMPRPMFG